jgi:hypothetical protein
LQITHPATFLVHAFALSLASKRWPYLGRPRRVAFVLAVALVTAPVVIAAISYSSRLLRIPESGHEFADNRTLAQALAIIPTSGSIIVTNDLWYPADNFGRDGRQMQIPALIGHQAFSANFSYEPVEDFSRTIRTSCIGSRNPRFSCVPDSTPPKSFPANPP